MIQHILRYAMACPDAKDTVEGIFKWWFPPDGTERSKAEVQKTIDSLVARGWLTQRQTASSHQIYGVNKEKLEEMQAFLDEPRALGVDQSEYEISN